MLSLLRKSELAARRAADLTRQLLIFSKASTINRTEVDLKSDLTIGKRYHV